METPALEHLVGAYLHQDFDLIGDIWDNVDVFVAESPDLAPLLPEEIEWALQMYSTEAELEALVDGLGCELVLSDGDRGYRGFLQEIARRVQAALARQH